MSSHTLLLLLLICLGATAIVMLAKKRTGLALLFAVLMLIPAYFLRLAH